ncbi:MAG: SCP2 sterol-binding domain-containing protein [Methylotenera sp.]|nr:SCP2 sterol-binding domain-containing protein [Methylotenera sp.]MDO9233281.1 SCP2 sterol-binding domain-containing protein [Methylotenera sp.]MDO9388191.1 SCP2 sterol-binding domain-containing protein [Methylotenera sp.]MDP1596150.1 SCP2 sterol-binding domain-containing protein [Methylotenera sp.]MDP1959544.1 SCP2 sterol-binding domain-containing protein [Methylotenera sp.]
MFKQISTRLLQHLITQNSWANELLQPFAGKSVQLNIALVNTSLVILENGSLAIAGDTNIPDATIIIAPSLLLRLVAKDEAAKLQIKIEGDTYLATELAKVFSNMRWDYEDDLSKIVGDVPAYKLGELGRQAVNTVKEAGINLTEMLSEYWQEEKPMIAKKRHVEQFNAEVDTLRADVERLEKRLNKLAKTNAVVADFNQ